MTNGTTLFSKKVVFSIAWVLQPTPSYDFPNFPNDGRDSYFELYIEGLSNNVASTDEANRAITFMVPLPNYSKPGDYVTYDNQGTGRCVQHEITSDRTLDRFRVSLRHTDGTIVDFNGRDWTAVFLIVYRLIIWISYRISAIQ